MLLTDEQIAGIWEKDLHFKTSRSGGKGGQNVNKVESKVELEFNIPASQSLSPAQKTQILRSSSTKMRNGIVYIVAQEDRSQIRNKEIAFAKLLVFLQQALHIKKKRKVTKPGKAAKEKNLRAKKIQKQKKELRRPYRGD